MIVKINAYSFNMTSFQHPDPEIDFSLFNSEIPIDVIQFLLLSLCFEQIIMKLGLW